MITDRIPQQHERTVTVYGETIHYYDVGEGPTVILLHALGWYGEIWAPVLTRLASKYRVIAVDQIGCGESSKPFLDYKVQRLLSSSTDSSRLPSWSVRRWWAMPSAAGWLLCLHRNTRKWWRS